jgi:transposase
MEYFVAGTTARAASELVGVHRNTAASFLTRLRKLIADEMEKASPFLARLKWTRATTVECAKGNEAGERPGKCRFSGC